MRYTKFIGWMAGVFLLFGSTLYAQESYRSHQGGRDLFKMQYGTGQEENNNCAPTAMAMIETWLGYESQSISEIRNQMTRNSGWIYTHEVEAYMQQKEIPYKKEGLWEKEDLLKYLEQGILLLCMDLSKISRAQGNTLIGRTSSDVTGHFIVAAGYYEQQGSIYIEVMDPLNTEVRYYLLEELFDAAYSWWSNVYIYQ